MSYVVCRMSYVVCRKSYGVCRMSYVVYRTYVVCRMAVCRMSYVVSGLTAVVGSGPSGLTQVLPHWVGPFGSDPGFGSGPPGLTFGSGPSGLPHTYVAENTYIW